MILVLGGAYQGKLTWAVETFDLARTELWDLEQADPAPGAACYYHLEELTRRHTNPEQFLHILQEGIVIAREIGSGVVPLSEEERLWRERHGKFLRLLAARANRVVRIFCGLSEELK